MTREFGPRPQTPEEIKAYDELVEMGIDSENLIETNDDYYRYYITRGFQYDVNDQLSMKLVMCDAKGIVDTVVIRLIPVADLVAQFKSPNGWINHGQPGL